MKSTTTNYVIYPTQNMWYNNSVSKSCDKRALSVFTSHSLCIAQRVSYVQNYIFNIEHFKRILSYIETQQRRPQHLKIFVGRRKEIKTIPRPTSKNYRLNYATSELFKQVKDRLTISYDMKYSFATKIDNQYFCLCL